ncbi:MAG TPA: CBS domain-containing protein [Pyrinomonadaceae bacterium]|jgi:CBS domain-containing protein
MSRYRNDRDDDDYYGGSRYGRERGAYDESDAPRGGDYYGRRGAGGGARDDDDYARDRYSNLTGYRQGERRDEPGYGGGGRSRYYDERPTRRRGGGGGGGGGDLYAAREQYERERYDRDDDERGRSLWDEGREYFRRTFGTGGGRERERRGATRSHVRCRDIMTRDVTVATRETMLEEVAKMMRDEDTGVIPVVERTASDLTDLAETRPDMNRVQANVVGNGKLVGLITDRDIVVRAIAEGKDARTTRAEEIMTSEVHTAQPNDRVIDAIRKMGDKQVRRIPVVDRDGTLRGIISMADVALETQEDRELADALEEISSGSSFWNRVFG